MLLRAQLVLKTKFTRTALTAACDCGIWACYSWGLHTILLCWPLTSTHAQWVGSVLAKAGAAREFSTLSTLFSLPSCSVFCFGFVWALLMLQNSVKLTASSYFGLEPRRMWAACTTAPFLTQWRLCNEPGSLWPALLRLMMADTGLCRPKS
jgi:hypothetical protein